MSELPSGTVTFLFTDIEGSTRLWEEHPEAMRDALVRHDAALSAAIGGHGGHVFSTGGDGLAAVFPRAGDALTAATEAQAALSSLTWPTAAPLRVRMGLHTGEATERDGDYFGPAVNRAARLMAAGHGGQVLVSAATAAVVGTAGLVDLGKHGLRDLAEPQRVFQVGEAQFPPLRSLAEAATNLPIQPTSLIGRQRLIAELVDLVQECPLVTLTGVGGVGKTRLAVEVGAEMLPKFPHGVWLVDLAAVAQDELVLPSVAEVVGVAAQTGEPLETTLLSRLKTRRLLVILDNCEHVLTPVARLAERLAAGAPGVRVVVTSREPLGVAAERVRAVPSLAETTEAVDLFLERAANVGAVLDGVSQVASVREICARLDGLPLAIELAAARARMMSPAQIAERLDHRFRLLTGSSRTSVERHRTLQATVAWSYDLLDDVDRAVFRALSVMAGSFDLEAAEAVAGGGAVEPFAVLDALGRLVDKSMVLAVNADGSVRYRLLETLRQFGADRLAEDGDVGNVQDRHAAFFCHRARRVIDATGTARQYAVLADVEFDIGNYRAAFAHLLDTGQVVLAARGVLALDTYWQLHRAREGQRLLEVLIGEPGLEDRYRLRALAGAAQCAANVGDTHLADRCANEAIALAERLGVPPPWSALFARYRVASYRQDRPTHRHYWELAQNATRGRTYTQLLNESQRFFAPFGDEREEARDHYEVLLEKVLAIDDSMLAVVASFNLSMALYETGDDDRAREVVRFTLPRVEHGTPYVSFGFVNVAALLTVIGDLGDAVPALRRGLISARDEGVTLIVLNAAWVGAAIAVQHDDLPTAAVLLAGAARHADVLGIVGESMGYSCRLRAEAAVAASAADLAGARAKGAGMTVDDLTDCCLALLDRSSP
jgi:predicted ATPase/class 3 adenylate cyclase